MQGQFAGGGQTSSKGLFLTLSQLSPNLFVCFPFNFVCCKVMQGQFTRGGQTSSKGLFFTLYQLSPHLSVWLFLVFVCFSSTIFVCLFVAM